MPNICFKFISTSRVRHVFLQRHHDVPVCGYRKHAFQIWYNTERGIAKRKTCIKCKRSLAGT